MKAVLSPIIVGSMCLSNRKKVSDKVTLNDGLHDILDLKENFVTQIKKEDVWKTDNNGLSSYIQSWAKLGATFRVVIQKNFISLPDEQRENLIKMLGEDGIHQLITNQKNNIEDFGESVGHQFELNLEK